MKKKPTKLAAAIPGVASTKKTLLWAACILVAGAALLALLYAANDGPRMTKRIYQGYQARKAFDAELATLRQGLDPLGFKDLKSANSKCEYTQIYGYSTDQLFCVAQHRSYVVVNDANKTEINAAAKRLDQLMRQQGGTMSTNTTATFEEWFKDVTSGVDYYPDITGTIMNDRQLCAVAAFVAYSKPKPPAFTVTLVCNTPRLQKVDNYLL